MPPEVKWDKILTIQLLEEVMQIIMKFVNWIIKVTPFAIISLIAAAVGAQTDLAEVFSQIGVLIAAILVGLLIQVSVVYSGLYTLFVRKNPLKYYKHLIPAWMMAFASSSSAATIPVSLECVISSGEVPVGVARFVVPLGSTSKCRLSHNRTGLFFYHTKPMLLPLHSMSMSTVNKDGAAFNIISSCVWVSALIGVYLQHRHRSPHTFLFPSSHCSWHTKMV
jgi:hypothetical protein